MIDNSSLFFKNKALIGQALYMNSCSRKSNIWNSDLESVFEGEYDTLEPIVTLPTKIQIEVFTPYLKETGYHLRSVLNLSTDDIRSDTYHVKLDRIKSGHNLTINFTYQYEIKRENELKLYDWPFVERIVDSNNTLLQT